MGLKWLASGVEGLENVLHALTRGARICIEDYCQLETADDERNFVVTGGGLMSALRLEGLKQRLDEAAFEHFVEDVAIAFTPTMTRTAHTIQVVLERDPDRTPRELKRLFAPAYRATQRLGLSITDVLEDTYQRLLATCCSEQAYLTLWTHPLALTKPEKRQARKEYFKAINALDPTHPPLEGQNPAALFRPLRETHAAVVETLARDLNARGLF